MSLNNDTPIFPKATLSPVVPEGARAPTYLTVKRLQKELNKLAMSVPSYIPTVGYLALTVTPAVFLGHSGNVAFVAPVPPPINPVHEDGATQYQIAENLRQHKVNKATYISYSKVVAGLRDQVLDAVPEKFYQVLEDEDIGYANVTCLRLMTHLWTRYGTIQP